ncbi:MAG: DUF817 domain-containing protein [Cytophagales bacterium]|nr:DUF817 domain-containing protein [Armatimonadota bacterium]
MSIALRRLLPLAPRDLVEFARLEALSCLFPVGIFATLALSRVLPLPVALPRYDFILILCFLMQGGMIAAKLETKDEIKVICVFHAIGLALELFKIQMGSWAYPESAYTKIGGVPLYSGFMYASVASYVCQAWRNLHLQITGWPGVRWTAPLAALVYSNFFTHHWIPDLRWGLIAAVFLLFRRTVVHYRVHAHAYAMPLVLGFALIGLFIWGAENVATYFGAWQYPNQKQGWQIVHSSKITSWFLLVIITVVIVAQLKRVKERLHPGDEGENLNA